MRLIQAATHPIRKYASVISLQHAFQQWLSCSLVHLRLYRLIVEYTVKDEPPVFVSFCAWWQETAFHECSRRVRLLGIESEDAVVDDLYDLAQARLRCHRLCWRRKCTICSDACVVYALWKATRLPGIGWAHPNFATQLAKAAKAVQIPYLRRLSSLPPPSGFVKVVNNV